MNNNDEEEKWQGVAVIITWVGTLQWRSLRKPCRGRRRSPCIVPRMEWIHYSWPECGRRRMKCCQFRTAPFPRRWPWRWRRWRIRWRNRRLERPSKCADFQKRATFSFANWANWPALSQWPDHCPRSVYRREGARRSHACDHGSLRSNSLRWRPERFRRKLTLRRNLSDTRVLDSGVCPFGNSWGCAGKCPGHDRKSILSFLRRRRIHARSSQATCPDTFPAYCAMFQSDDLFFFFFFFFLIIN